MIEILKLGLKAVKDTTQDKQVYGVWTVYRKDQGRYILTSPFYGLIFMFASRSIPEMIHPSVIELIETGEIKKLGPPEGWTSERHGEVDLWLACLLKMLRNNNFSEDLVEKFLWYISNVPFEDWSEEIKSLVSQVTQMDKSEKYRFLAESAGDKKRARKLLESSQLNRSEIKKEFQGRNIPIIFLPPGGEEKGVLAQMCLWAYRQLRDQGREDNTLLGHVQKYIRGAVVDFFIKKGIEKPPARVVRNVSETILSHLLERYSVPSSYGSFSSYIRRCAPGFVSQETGSEFTMDTDFFQDSLEKKEFQDWERRERENGEEYGGLAGQNEEVIPFPDKEGCTVPEAARIIGCKEGWLYYQLRTGKIEGYEPEEIITEQETITRNRGNTILGNEAVEELEVLYLLKKASEKSSIAKIIAKKRRTELRAAQAWKKRRLDKGMSLAEILFEAGVKR